LKLFGSKCDFKAKIVLSICSNIFSFKSSLSCTFKYVRHLISKTEQLISLDFGSILMNKLSALLLELVSNSLNRFWCKSIGIINAFFNKCFLSKTRLENADPITSNALFLDEFNCKIKELLN